MSKSSSIDHSLINSLKTKDYLTLNSLKNTGDLKGIIPLCYIENESEDFLLHQAEYIAPASLEKVWKAYIEIPPADAWSGRRVQFSFSYDRTSDSISYLDDEYKGLFEGQLIFLEIKIAKGLLKLAVTHQVNQINEAEKSLKLCYVEGGKASGSQLIKLVENGPHSTKVIHDTYFKSDSKFRDKVLYPFVHGRIVGEFHKNVLKYLKNTA